MADTQASIQCTGSVLIFTGTGSSNTPEWFGTTEGGPEITFNVEWEPIFNDLGGSKIPTDRLYQGKEAVIPLTMTRWVEDVWGRLQIRPDRIPPAGEEYEDALGSLMMTEGLGFPVWLKYVNASKAAMSSVGMVAGYHFHRCLLEGPDKLPSGTKARKLGLVLRAFRDLQIPRPGGGVHSFAWRLFDNDMTDVAGIAIN